MDSKIDDLTRWLSAPAPSPEHEHGALLAARALEAMPHDELLAAVPALLPALINRQNVTGGSDAIDTVTSFLMRAPDSFERTTHAWLATFEASARRTLSRDLGRVVPGLNAPPDLWPADELDFMASPPSIPLRHQQLVEELLEELIRDAQMPADDWRAAMREKVSPAELGRIGGTKSIQRFCGLLASRIEELAHASHPDHATDSYRGIVERFGTRMFSPPRLEGDGPDLEFSWFEVRRYRMLVENVQDPQTEMRLEDLPDDVRDESFELGEELGVIDEQETLLLLCAVVQALQPRDTSGARCSAHAG